MVESDKEYVLQWTGHAAHVTERFSGLLARQALVDVTLICQGQKLRVHKLVLASCSLYFEEMLEQDLGQEPIILLRDLDFEVLKAMVEFMYCGETTISHCHLQILLDAAQVFKVKELECIVKSMLVSEKSLESGSLQPEHSKQLVDEVSEKMGNAYAKTRPSGEYFYESSISSDLEEEATSECKGDQTLENNAKSSFCGDEAEHSLYESREIRAIEITVNCSEEEEERDSSINRSGTCLESSESETSKMCTSEDDEEEAVRGTHLCREHDASTGTETNLKSIFGERCCDYSEGGTNSSSSLNEINSPRGHCDNQDSPSGVGECSKVYTHKKRKYAEREDYRRGRSVSDSPTESSCLEEECCSRTSKRLGKSLKVYTPKGRKSLEERKNCSSLSNNSISVTDRPKKPSSSTSCIDLSDEASRNNPPVTLPATLDMETSEYIWSLSSESIQYVVGCTINQPGSLISGKEGTFNEGSVGGDSEQSSTDSNGLGQIENELFSVGNGNLDANAPPVLRRSVRINQLENDDSINNNNTSPTSALSSSKGPRDNKHADIRSDDSTHGKTMKRKISSKDIESRVSDENNLTVTQSQQQALRKNSNNSNRSLRSSSKLTSGRTSAKTRCALARNDKDELKSKNNGKIKKLEGGNDCDIFMPMRLNTIASVDRALWGDMSDVLENREYAASLVADYSPSKEIPFAVGLLPLRAALERMQATLDHQPRKTRSSVAPFRHDLNGFKKKESESVLSSKRHSQTTGNESSDLVAPNTVCHIQIRTSSQCTQNRRTSPSEEILAVGSSPETNRR